MTNFLNHSLITITERTRELDLSHVAELKADIKKNGLLQPIILGDRSDHPLVDGLHRLTAVKELFFEGEVLSYDGSPLEYDNIPFVRFADLEPVRLLEVEIAANIWRKELTWQERNNALAKLHAMQKELNPDATFSSTATKLANVTGRSVQSLERAISRATVLASAMEQSPELASARSETEAFTRVKSDITRLATGLLAGGFATTHSLHRLIEGDFRQVLPTFEGEGYDLILADPPYGVGADGWTSKFKDAPHDYKDTYNHAMSLYATLFLEGFRVGKPRSNIFAFCAVEYWHTLRDMAEDAGWSTWPRPIIWHKSNEGIRPWGGKGYAYCYEAILLACKGERGLSRTGPDVLTGIYKVRDREHGAAKPAALYENLISSCCLPGDAVLDPCCGSGTIFEASTLASCIATGIEINPHFIGLSQQRMQLDKPTLDKEELDTF
jgi:DNA modification methylase